MRQRPTTAASGRRRRTRRSANLKNAVVLVLTAVLAGALAVVAFTSPIFNIERTVVIGAETVPAEQVVAALGLTPETNIFLIRKRAMVRRLLSNPVIKRAVLFRSLPDGLTVRVVERKADLVLSAGDALYDVDSSGVPFRIVTAPAASMPVISCSKIDRVVLGRPIRDRGFRTAMECLRLARRQTGLSVSKIAVDQNNDLCLNVGDGFPIRLGRPEQLSRKIGIAERMIKEFPDLQRQGVYIDVTCPDAPAMKLRT